MATKNKTKIYFWIKLDENFFKNLAIKNLRKTVTGGDTLVIIYQQMLLSSLANNGVIYYEGTLQDIAQEIALNLDEKLDDVRLAIDYFQKAGLLQIGDDGSAEMLQVPMLIGQETNWNKYKRDKKLENFQPTSNQLPKDYNQAPTEIEIELDIEKEIDKEASKATPAKSNFQELIELYQKNFGIVRPILYDDLKADLEDYGIELIVEAVKRTVKRQREYGYAQGILKSWNNKGIKTLEQAKAEEISFQNKSQKSYAQTQPKSVKNVPDWTDEGKLTKAGVDTTGLSQNEMYKLAREMGLN